MTARPHPAGGQITGPLPHAAPSPRDETDDLAAAVDAALAACHRVERALRRSIAVTGVTATARRLGISRSATQRFKGGRWHVTATLTKLRDNLRAGP